MKRFFLFVLFLIMNLNLIGCDTLYRSRIYIRTLPFLSTTDAEYIIKEFSLHHGYTIRQSDKNDPWVKQEIGVEQPVTIWIAQKKYEPTILFTTMTDAAAVRLIQLSGAIRPSIHRKYTEELYLLLKDKFGGDNVSLLEN
ncbi:hypothetical protein [Geobacter metallireducens]|uniref:hypothetical protein n=1 Tax=Geobacter metallireducens TaxID=28232 RepID=UPI00110FFF08|nr:hypothetical protein [Geobacter metallireducens]